VNNRVFVITPPVDATEVETRGKSEVVAAHIASGAEAGAVVVVDLLVL
jgi:hypothetical protein